MDVLTQIPNGILGGASAAGMFALLFWLLATERLVTGAQYRRAIKQNEILRETIAKQQENLDNAMNYSETVIDIVKGIRNEARREGDPQ